MAKPGFETCNLVFCRAPAKDIVGIFGGLDFEREQSDVEPQHLVLSTLP